MTQWLVVLSLVIVCSSTAQAEEPTGFAGFAWGTPRLVVSDELVKERCPWHMTYTTTRGYQRIVCNGYQLSAVGPVYLTLDFVDEVFTGYSIAVPRQLGAALRAAARDILGTPSRPAAGTSQRTWKASVDISEFTCLPSSVCLTVTAYPAPIPALRGPAGDGHVNDPEPAARASNRAKGGLPSAPPTVLPSAQPVPRSGAPP